MRKRRSFSSETCEQGVGVSVGPFELDGLAVGVVADRSGEILFARQPVDEGTETNTLNNAANRCEEAALRAVLSA